jgi:hypothetical protein
MPCEVELYDIIATSTLSLDAYPSVLLDTQSSIGRLADQLRRKRDYADRFDSDGNGSYENGVAERLDLGIQKP